MTTPDPMANTAIDAIDSLEARLRRIEYLLTGANNWAGDPERISSPPTSIKDTVLARVAALEHDLRRLGSKVPAVHDVLMLYSRFPDLFQTPSSQQIPTMLSTQALASIVLSYATAFPETASRLSSLQDLPIPPAKKSTSLIELRPRLDQLAAVQEDQAREIAELRTRGALLMTRWIELGIVGGGELWGDWEERVKLVEKEVRRAEASRADSDG
ncbi:hypothetical protein FQN57_003906 [Myotisia sp. PD_48]|nr:hypothetical protein FQN57_003906 [Myotisia sp. PD_48]